MPSGRAAILLVNYMILLQHMFCLLDLVRICAVWGSVQCETLSSVYHVCHCVIGMKSNKVKFVVLFEFRLKMILYCLPFKTPVTTRTLRIRSIRTRTRWSTKKAMQTNTRTNTGTRKRGRRWISCKFNVAIGHFLGLAKWRCFPSSIYPLYLQCSRKLLKKVLGGLILQKIRLFCKSEMANNYLIVHLGGNLLRI